jgi:hypothetical protein
MLQGAELAVRGNQTRLKFLLPLFWNYIYRVIQEESAILWEIIVCVILGKKVHMNMGPILNGYRDYGKKTIWTILRARTAIT